MGIRTVTRSGWKITKKYAKRHIFHMMIIVAFAILGISHVSQYAIIGAVYGLTALNKGALTSYQNQVVIYRQNDKQFILKAIEAQGIKFTETVAESKMQLNSRLDILNSTIKPEKKHRMLVAKVRNAIIENTNTRLTIRDLNNIAFATIKYSHQYNLSIAKVLAQIRVESNFNIKAHSGAEADGLMQIIPETWEYINLKEMNGKKMYVHNVYHNIRSGCFYMSEQVMKFNTYNEALMAYNWGPHRVRMLKSGVYDENDIPEETKNYVPLVNGWMKVFEKYGLE